MNFLLEYKKLLFKANRSRGRCSARLLQRRLQGRPGCGLGELPWSAGEAHAWGFDREGGVQSFDPHTTSPPILGAIQIVFLSESSAKIHRTKLLTSQYGF